MEIITGSLIFLLSALLQGLSGFGFSILAVPLITLILPPVTAVPILIIYSIIINIVVLVNSKEFTSVKRIWPLLLCALIAIPAGAEVLTYLPEKALRVMIGIFIIVFGLIFLKGSHWKIRNEKVMMIPTGLLSGFLGGSISTSGPPVIIFFTSLRLSKHKFRGNLAFYFLILNLVTIPVYFIKGLFTPAVFSNTLNFLPALIIGVISGNLLSSKIKDKHFRLMVNYLLILTGLMSVISAIF